jgi:hypothetical protein
VQELPQSVGEAAGHEGGQEAVTRDSSAPRLNHPIASESRRDGPLQGGLAGGGGTVGGGGGGSDAGGVATEGRGAGGVALGSGSARGGGGRGEGTGADAIGGVGEGRDATGSGGAGWGQGWGSGAEATGDNRLGEGTKESQDNDGDAFMVDSECAETCEEESREESEEEPRSKASAEEPKPSCSETTFGSKGGVAIRGQGAGGGATGGTARVAGGGATTRSRLTSSQSITCRNNQACREQHPAFRGQLSNKEIEVPVPLHVPVCI